MSQAQLTELIQGVRAGRIVPYLGAGALNGARNDAGDPVPADSDSLILAMNKGKPMAPRLMYEFPRAAMHLELKAGRNYVTRFFTDLYEKQTWSRSAVHTWLAGIKPPYVIDINRDTQLQDTYADTPHTLVVGVARIGGTEYRFKLFQWDGNAYHEIKLDAVDTSLPVLFKPMGTPRPEPNFIASDADYVDYITELMGGFAIPSFLKSYRQAKQYLFIGLRLTRDTERMVMADITYDAGEPRGWALIPEPTAKERRYCARQGIEIIEAGADALLRADGAEELAELAADATLVGC
ncbi:MAG: SIR2 family protein [Gammaproteobacteria bacterium]|jgi:hypothetical protein